MENSVSSVSGTPYSWEILEDEHKEFYVQCKLADGRILLKGQPSKSYKGVEKQQKAAAELARKPDNFRELEQSGKFYLSLQDTTGKEVGRSESYLTKAAMQADLSIFKEVYVPAVDTLPADAGEEKFTLVFTRNNKGEYTGRIAHSNSCRFIDFYNLNTEMISSFVGSNLPELPLVRAAPVRLLLYNDLAERATNIVSRERQALKLVLHDFPEVWLPNQVCRLQLKVSTLGGRAVVGMQISTQLTAESRLTCVLPAANFDTGAYRIQANCFAENDTEVPLQAAGNCLFQVI